MAGLVAGKKLVSIALVAAGAVAVSIWALPSIANFLFDRSTSAATRKSEKQTQRDSSNVAQGAGNDAKVLLKLSYNEALNVCFQSISSL